LKLKIESSFFCVCSDVDSSKLDLSKELANDFTHSFDNSFDPTDLQLTTDDFVNKFSTKKQILTFRCSSCSMRLIFPLIRIYVMKHFEWKTKQSN